MRAQHLGPQSQLEGLLQRGGLCRSCPRVRDSGALQNALHLVSEELPRASPVCPVQPIRSLVTTHRGTDPSANSPVPAHHKPLRSFTHSFILHRLRSSLIIDAPRERASEELPAVFVRGAEPR